MTEPTEHDWSLWRSCPPDPHGNPVEVFIHGWEHPRLWRPAGPPPEDAPGLLWRPGSKALRTLAVLGGIYDADGKPLYGSPALIYGVADANGPWAEMFVIGPEQRDTPVSRLWLVPPCLELVEVPCVVLGDLVAAADRAETLVMRGPDIGQLRRFAEQVVAMSGGGWS